MSVDTKNISFKKLTKQSIRNIHERILNEKTRRDIEKTEKQNAELNNLDNSMKQRKSFKKRKKGEDIFKEPNKDFMIGNSLPRRYQILFPEKLYGGVIEDVDPYWKNSYVNTVKKIG